MFDANSHEARSFKSARGCTVALHFELDVSKWRDVDQVIKFDDWDSQDDGVEGME
jgi:hypothetical protein